MDLRYRRPRGTRDVLLEEMERWRWCEERWREVLERYGFGEIRTPLIEPTDLFTRAVGSGTDIVDKEMYSFETKGGEPLTLRPEATASVVRAYLENGLTRQPGTMKFYYLGPMFRYDRPQAGRYRQFHQVGVEAIGSPSPVLDAEVIRAAMALFEAVDAEGLTVQVNTIGCRECVRGLDYYTRTTFEISARQDLRQSALCGGGRYDGLVEQCGGPPTPAVGFSMGVERTLRHLYPAEFDPQLSRQSPVDVYMACLGQPAMIHALAHAELLRGVCRVEVDTTGRGIKAQMKGAHSRGARLVLIAGDEELAAGGFQMKDLNDGHQREVAGDGLLAAVREVLGL